MKSSELHFLVVDDLITVRRIIIALLELLGHTAVSEAEDGAHALELLRERHAGRNPVNFVITDWNMPVMDGLSLVRAMRSSQDLHHVPVLMVSSEFGHQNLIAAKQAGVDEYISKLSLSADLLGEALNRILIAKQGAM
jgi:two-component system chemotaxis response regulator CheY